MCVCVWKAKEWAVDGWGKTVLCVCGCDGWWARKRREGWRVYIILRCHGFRRGGGEDGI